MTTKELVWREVSIQRPYEMETLFNILTHIACLLYTSDAADEL